MTEIRLRYTEEQALDIIDKIKNKLYDTDLDVLCGEKVEVFAGKDFEEIYKKFIQAIRCGLVYWDEEKNCLTQALIRPIQAGQQNADTLYYRTPLKLRDTKNFNSKNQGELTIQSLASICGRSEQLIGELWGQDLTIAVACLSFFDK